MIDAEFFERLRARPSMYGLDGSYYPTATYFLGLDQALSGSLLRGFDEWLSVRSGELSSHVWVARVLTDAVPGLVLESAKSPGDLTAEQNQRAVEELFSLVLEFLPIRNDRQALAGMYAQHRRLCSWEG